MITKTPQTAVLYGPRIGSVQPEVKSLTAVPQLEAGKIALATVVESRGQNMFMLETAGVRFEVQSDLPLIKGEQIQFQVVKTAPVLELQKVDPGLPAQVRQTLVLAGDIVDVKPLLQILRSSFFLPRKILTGTLWFPLEILQRSQLVQQVHQAQQSVQQTQQLAQ